MFWTSVVCGVGGSLGACVGLMAFVFLFHASRKCCGRDEAFAEYNERSLAALQRRNEIGERTACALERIADVAAKEGCVRYG